jgi:ABC-type nitrate/sulfonate/bicarbonate transport system substrate-binding protein
MTKRQRAGLFRVGTHSLIAGSVALMTALMPAMGSTQAATAIKIGRTSTGTLTHLPIYVAMETGLFKQEGLDATFVSMTERALVTAGLAGRINFVPMPDAGIKAALKGAPVRFVVGQALFPPLALVAARNIGSLEQLRDQTLGFGQLGQDSYHDGEIVLRESFGFALGADYQAIAMPSEDNRLAALESGEIQAGLFSLPYAAKAEARGFKRLLRTGIFLPRLNGAVWTTAKFANNNRYTVRRFIRAIARATDIIHMDGKTTIAVIRKYLRVYDRRETKALWHSVRDIFSADIPALQLKELFQEHQIRIKQKGRWPRGKRLPNTEYFVTRDLLTRTLYQRQYKLQALGTLPRAR